MSSSEIRVDTIKTRAGLGTVTISPSGLQFSGIVTSENRLDVKSYDGTPGRLDLYCESSNVHYARIQAPDHADFSGNLTLTLPNTAGTLLNSDVSGNVGIGTDNPTELLHLSADSAHEILLKRGGGAPSEVRFANEGNLAVISNNTNGISFETGVTPSEAMRINASGSVGIGTDAPEETLTVYETGTAALFRGDNYSVSALTSTPRIRFGTDITYDGYMELGAFNNINNLDTKGRDFNLFSSSVDPILYVKHNTGRVGINTTSPATKLSVAGNIRVENSTDETQYLTISYQGIDFQNTGAGSSTTSSAHLLDDYEEGLWTPTITGSTSAGTASYTSQNGSYEKIGRQVTLRGYINWSSHTGTGNLEIRGMPFPSTTGSFDYIQPGSAMLNNIVFASGRTQGNVYIANGSTVISLFMSGNSTTYTANAIEAAGAIIFSITYTTDS